MSMTTPAPARAEVFYPDSDGQPMADNTLQWEWMVTIKGGLDAVFRNDPDVFVAGNLLWYPVEGDPTTRAAPDAMVIFGRPKGYRGSYQHWREGGLAPQVVFEVLSPGNRQGRLVEKFRFYDRYGVEEYYVYDPDDLSLDGWLRQEGELRMVPEMNGWISPRLGVRLEIPPGGELRLLGPDGRPFASYVELAQQRNELARENNALAHQRDELARENNALAHQRNELAQQHEAERLRAERLAERLRAMGADPEA